MSNLLPFQNQVGEWAVETFPQATRDSWVAHMRREIEELADSHDGEEAADILILLLGHAYINGYDLLHEARMKMLISRLRTWGEPNEEGVVEHIHPEPTEQGGPQ